MYNHIISVSIPFVIALFSVRVKFLTAAGAILAFFIGFVIIEFGGIVWFFSIAIFYISSSIISKILPSQSEIYNDITGKGSQRDFKQVMANGLTSILAVIVYKITSNNIWYSIYLSGLACATADTWATEFGKFSKHKPRMITTLKVVPKGQSGAISILGTAATVLGSFFVAFIGVTLFKKFCFGNVSEAMFTHVFIITLCGVLGSLFDSLLGATLQILYQCQQCGVITEKKKHCEKKTFKVKGLKFFDNDIVNLLSTIFSASLAYLLI